MCCVVDDDVIAGGLSVTEMGRWSEWMDASVRTRIHATMCGCVHMARSSTDSVNGNDVSV